MATQQKKSQPSQKFSGKLSLVIPCYNEAHRIDRMIDGLREFSQKAPFDYEVIIADDGSTDGTSSTIDQHPLMVELKQAGRYQLVKLAANRGKGAALKAGVNVATGSHILTLDADMATKPAEVLKWMAANGNQLPSNEIWIASREHHDSLITENPARRRTGRIFNLIVRFLTPLRLRDSQCGFKLYPAPVAKELFEKQKSTGWAHDVELMYRAQIHDIPIRDLPVTWVTQEGSKISPVKDSFPMLWNVLMVSLRLKWEYFVKVPLSMIGKKNVTDTVRKREATYRMLFFFFSIVLFFTMTTLSFQYGITGDDVDQKIYGEKVLSYYLTLGKDTSCLHLKVGNKENLHLYGGLFNMIPAAASKIFPAADIYDLRHLFDAITGFLAMLFAGLLAKKLGGWRAGFLGLVLMAIWPQFFGQSMNNPKDIPFAFAYVFSIYYLLKLVDELPGPRTRTLILSTIGIALAINMRVGGLILIGMLFAFVIGNYILSKSFRQAFTIDKNATGKTIKYLLIISVVSYFGGLLFWPYGLMAPFSHPFTALSEITNFSINIKVLFNGKRMFSNEIPWNYVPVWLWVTTPLVIIIAAVLIPVVILLARKQFNVSYLLLIVFATVFPWAYIVYKNSSLYDGMRQVLFITPTIGVLAAVTWEFFFRSAKSKGMQYGVAAALLIGILLPLRFSFANHPNQYVYFNELYGGIKHAYGNFDTDYYMNSIREDCDWVKENVKTESGKKIIIGTNTVDPVNWYLGRDTVHYKIVYVRFNERTQRDWDFGIFYTRPIERSQLLNNSWLGSHTLYKVTADGIPLSAVMERRDKNDFYAEQAQDANDFAKADSLFRLAVQYEPLNELSWYGLAVAQMQQQKLKDAIGSLQRSLQIYPDNPTAFTMLGLAYAQTGDAENGIAYLNQSLKLNPNNPQAYYYLALIYQQKGDVATAKRYMDIVKQFQPQQK